NTKSTTLYLPAIGKDAKGLCLVSSVVFCSFSSKLIIPIQLFIYSLYPLYFHFIYYSSTFNILFRCYNRYFFTITYFAIFSYLSFSTNNSLINYYIIPNLSISHYYRVFYNSIFTYINSFK